MALGQVFLRVLHFSFRYHSARMAYSIPVRRTSVWSQRTFTQRNVVLDIREHWAQKCFPIVFQSCQFTLSQLVQGWRGKLVRGEVWHTHLQPFSLHFKNTVM